MTILMPIAVLVLIGFASAVAWGKRDKLGLGGTMMGRHHQPPRPIIDLDRLYVGRLAGDVGIKPQRDGTSTARYKKGWFSSGMTSNIPDEAIKTFHPPQCEQPEGITIVLPHSPNSPLVRSKLELQTILNQKNYISVLEETVQELSTTIQEGVNIAIVKERLQAAMDMMKKYQQVGTVPETEKTTVIQAPKPDKPQKAK